MAATSRQSRFTKVIGATALFTAGWLLGQTSEPRLVAQPAAKSPVVQPATPSAPAADKRVVAYINGNTPITREEFGEFLIKRYGPERIELFVNRKIIDAACTEKGISATDHEVLAQVLDDCRLLGIDMKQFQANVLKRYGKTMYEWNEDVIRPRIMLAKLCRDKIQVADEDLRKTFENRYGKKVKAKIIIWPPKEEKIALKMYDEIRKDDAAFNRAARMQPDPALAAREGQVEPISRWSVTGENTIEDEAFKLQPGEVSKLIGTPIGTVVIKCTGFVEPDTKVDFEKVKPDLLKEALDKKISVEAPKLCEELKKQAAPKYFLSPARPRLEEEVKSELELTGGVEKKQ